MSFAAPALLALLPLALTPVLVHLLYKRRRATIDFPSLRLLRRVELRLSPRRKLRERLLLACRCLFLALLVLAVARPVSQAAAGAAGAVDYLIVLDNTGSMRLGRSGDTAFDVARRRAAEVIEALRPGDRAALLPLVPPPGWTAADWSADRSALRRALEALPCSDASFPPEALPGRIEELRARSTAPRIEVLLLSDFRGPAAGLAPAVPEALRVDCAAGGNVPADLGLELLEVAPSAPLRGRPVVLRVRVRNGGSEEAAAPLTLRLRDRPLATRRVTVPAGGSATVELTLPGSSRVGWTYGSVDLPPDSFPPDDRAFFVLRVRDRLRAVVVDPALETPAPDPAAGGRFLTLLLDPDGTGATSGIAARRIAPSAPLPADADLIAVCGYATLGRLDAPLLRSFVARGGLLLVLAEPEETPGDLPDWLGVRTSGGPPRPRDPAGGVRFAREGAEVLADLTVERELDLEAAGKETRTLLVFDDGKPALTAASVEQGYVVCAGFGLAPAWGGFTFHPAVLAELHRLAARYARAPRILTAQAGGVVKPAGPGPVRLVGEDGAVLFESGPQSPELGPLLEAGIYGIEGADEGGPRYLAVAPAAEEAHFGRTADPERIGPDRDLGALLAARVRTREYAPGLLLAALLLAIAEALLANRGGRRAVRRAAELPPAPEERAA